MNVYTILFYLNEDSSCGCDDHSHDHNDGCGCGSHEHTHEHNHEHGETCGSDDCGCGHDHSHGTVRDDSDVVGVIKTLGAWANFMPDSYLVKSEFTANQITEKISAVLEPKDLLFVTKVDKDDVASLTPGVVDWIRQ